jgi:hypothetical protein
MCAVITIAFVCGTDVSLRLASVKVIWACKPIVSHDWTLNHYMINLAVMLSLLSLVFEGKVRASGDGVYGSEGWET